MEFVDINQLIGETLELVRGKAQKTRIVLRSDLADDLPPVFGRRIQLQQVMFNLFTNAIEAIDDAADDSRLLVVSSAFSPPRDVLVAVTDSGPGLAAENLNRIFDPFFTTKSQGMGMGLSICRSIVEAHDGRLAARSGAERGAVFEMTLPAADMSRLSPPGRAAT